MDSKTSNKITLTGRETPQPKRDHNSNPKHNKILNLNKQQMADSPRLLIMDGPTVNYLSRCNRNRPLRLQTVSMEEGLHRDKFPKAIEELKLDKPLACPRVKTTHLSHNPRSPRSM